MLFQVNKNLYSRIKKYSDTALPDEKNDSKSSYWINQSKNIKINFKNNNQIEIFGESGIYFTKKKNLYNLIKKLINYIYRIVFDFQNSLFNYKKTFNNLNFQTNNFKEKILIDKNLIKFRDYKSLSKNFFPDRIINQKIIYCYYFFNILNGRIDFEKKNIVCEIGPGNGNLVSIIKKNFPLSKFILIDLKETILASSTYLSNLFPDKRFFFPNEIESKINLNLLEKYDFIFLTPNQIELIENNMIDVSINTSSFVEMEKTQIKKYFDLVQKISKNNSYFFNYNRVEKFPVDGYVSSELIEPNRFHEYPFYKNKIEFFQICDFAKKIQQDPMFLRLEKIVK